ALQRALFVPLDCRAGFWLGLLRDGWNPAQSSVRAVEFTPATVRAPLVSGFRHVRTAGCPPPPALCRLDRLIRVAIDNPFSRHGAVRPGLHAAEKMARGRLRRDCRDVLRFPIPGHRSLESHGAANPASGRQPAFWG